jgi:hypothetical protein
MAGTHEAHLRQHQGEDPADSNRDGCSIPDID